VEQVGETRRHRLDGRRVGEVGILEAGERPDRTGQCAAWTDRALEGRGQRLVRVEEDRADLDDLRRRVVRETGRLQIDDRQRARLREEVLQRDPIETEVSRVALEDFEGARRRSRRNTRDPVE
jgi:hypothetical protein